MTWRLALTIALCGGVPTTAQIRANSVTPLTSISIPFVGCPSFGQIGVLEAPEGASQLIHVSEQEGQALADYKSADGISVFAPRGCIARESQDQADVPSS